MKVEISIANDAELRAHIRDCIKGEISSVARGMLKDALNGNLEVNINGMIRRINLPDLVKQEVEKQIRQEMKKYTDAITKMSSEIDALIRKLVADKVTAEIKVILGVLAEDFKKNRTGDDGR